MNGRKERGGRFSNPKYTEPQRSVGNVRSIFNDEFLGGLIQPGQFLGKMLAIAEETRHDRDYRFMSSDAMKATSIVLGQTHHSSMMLLNPVGNVIREGNDNPITQGLVRVLTAEHIASLRTLNLQGDILDAEEAYLLSIYHRPDLAGKEDAVILCDKFKGEPPSPLLPNPKSKPVFYPARIYMIMATALRVFDSRTDLIDPDVSKAINAMPGRIDEAILVPRVAGLDDDRESQPDSLKAIALQLKSLGQRLPGKN